MPAVLIVDDEPGILFVITQILKGAGYDVHTAENAETGLELVRKIHPDVVMLDIRLPDMDGPEVLKEIKKSYPEIPVIMCSGFTDVETAIQTIKIGASNYISKPFKNEEVLRVIKDVLTQRIVERVRPVGVRKKEVVIPARKPTVPFKVVLPIAAVLVLGIIGFTLIKIVPQKSASPVTFKAPYSHPTALAFDGTNLWVSSWFTQTIYKHKLDSSFEISSSYYFPTLHPTGLAWGDNCIWTCDSWTRKIYRHNLDTTLSIAASYDSPGNSPSGLFWDGVNLWSSDVVTDKIYKHKLDERLSVMTIYDSPGSSPVGIFSDGKIFWSADSETNKIYKHRLDDKLTVIGVYTPEVHRREKLTSLTGSKKLFWTVSEEIGMIYQDNIKSMKFFALP